ncbi:MAG TPA: isochorismatase family protein [Capsulimonadaceae bacterium]|jgi:nicotinamidase-related amidase
MISRHPYLLDRTNTVLVAVDLQEPFLRTIHERERVISQSRLLIKAAQALGVPVITTLQYAARMGGLVPEIAELFADTAEQSFDKLVFSCCGSDEFTNAVAASGRKQVLLCGVETHICVNQTALDLLHRGYQVHVAPDAVSSRTLERHKLGMEKMRDAGVVPCASEGAVFELLYAASEPEFKAIHAIVK